MRTLRSSLITSFYTSNSSVNYSKMYYCKNVICDHARIINNGKGRKCSNHVTEKIMYEETTI